VKIGLVTRLPLLGNDSSAYAAVARKAEECGFDSLWMGDHIAFPAVLPETYPYSDTGRGPHAENMSFFDPWVALTFLASVTENVRLGTNVYILPLRDPFSTAKAVATADVISGGRMVLGIGVGWLDSEFAALGQNFKNRGRRCDELIDAIKALWTQETPEFHGEHYSFSGVKFEPKPLQKPHPPIYYGGNSPAALRRTAERCDGWLGAPGSVEELARCLQELDELRRKAGRDHLPFEVSQAFVGRLGRDDILRRAELGVDRVTVLPWSTATGVIPLETALGEIERLADEISTASVA
jgi:probable F420-dependent oxidoreductase